MIVDETCSFFKALADPTRRKILEVLSEKVVLSSKDLEEITHKSQSTISQHLKLLVDVGILDFRQDHWQKIYSIKASDIYRTLMKMLETLPESTVDMLSDNTRLSIIDCIRENKNTSRDFQERTGKTAPTIHENTEKLCAEHIIEYDKENGRLKRFRFANPAVLDAIGEVTQFLCAARDQRNEAVSRSTIKDTLFVESPKQPLKHRIAIMGLDNAGKTSIALSLKGITAIGEYQKVAPTTGMQPHGIVDGDDEYTILDFSGQEAYRSSLAGNVSHLVGVDKIIYVIDVQDVGRHDVALEYLQEVIGQLKSSGTLSQYQVNVFFHKCDKDSEVINASKMNEIIESLVDQISQIATDGMRIDFYETAIATVFSKKKLN